MTMRSAGARRVGVVIAIGLIPLLVSACVGEQQPGASNDVCAGVSEALGGCAPGQPTFSGDTCAEVGREYGEQLDDRGLEIINGPAVAEGSSRAVRLNDLKVLAAIRANQHLRERGLIQECGVEEFVAAAEAAFSDEFRSRAGDFLSDGDPVSFEAWLEDLRSVLVILDQEEGASDATPAPSR